MLIDDVQPDAFELLLKFMYSSVGLPASVCGLTTVPGGIPQQLALPLFTIADRYDVEVSASLQAATGRSACRYNMAEKTNW